MTNEDRRAYWDQFAHRLTVRAFNSLINAEIDSIDMLRFVMTTREARKVLLYQPNLGKKTLAEYDALVGVHAPEPIMTAAEKLARAVLLFHRGGRWTDEDRANWRKYTWTDEATTKTLCDLARSLLPIDL